MLTTLVWLLSLSDESNLLMIFLHFHLLSEPTTICGCLDRTRTDSAGIKTQIANQLQSRGIIYTKNNLIRWIYINSIKLVDTVVIETTSLECKSDILPIELSEHWNWCSMPESNRLLSHSLKASGLTEALMPQWNWWYALRGSNSRPAHYGVRGKTWTYTSEVMQRDVQH